MEFTHEWSPIVIDYEFIQKIATFCELLIPPSRKYKVFNRNAVHSMKYIRISEVVLKRAVHWNNIFVLKVCHPSTGKCPLGSIITSDE